MKRIGRISKRIGGHILSLFFIVVALIAWPTSSRAEGSVLFENHLPAREHIWDSSGWGYEPTNLIFDKLGINYFPQTDQEVCTVKIGIAKVNNPTDDLTLEIRQGPIFHDVDILQVASISSDQVLERNTEFEPLYAVFQLKPCIIMSVGELYSFSVSRGRISNISLGEGAYIFQMTRYTSNFPIDFWLHKNGIWGRAPFEWKPPFRLEGELVVPEPQPSPEAPAGEARTPVLIIPGIAGSELKNGDDLIWADLFEMAENNNDEQIAEYLGLDADGVPINSSVKVGDAIKRIFRVPLLDVNIFKDLEEKLEQTGYMNDEDLLYFPYDWRLNLVNTASLLADKIEEIKRQTGVDKVDIVAHSMGGLLTKEYMFQYGDDSVRKLIFVGTPHLGAPKAGKVILAGDRLSIPWLEEDRIEELGEHSIAMHELLPSFAYFDRVGSYIRHAVSQASGDLLDYAQTKELLIEQGSSPSVFAMAENFFVHGLEDMPLSGVETYNIAGCGGATQGGYEIRDDGTIALTKYRAGDKTVPLASGDGINLPAGRRFYSTDGEHAELPSRPGVRNLIADLLTDTTTIDYSNVSEDISTCGIEGQELIWRSPVEVHIYDGQGRHTGPIENNGVEYGIPGVDYEIYGHEKFIFIPAGENYRVVAYGLDNGTFDLQVRQNDNGEVTSATVFNDVPVNKMTEVGFETDGVGEVGGIQIDEDGDGGFEDVPVTAVLNGVQADDITPPQVLITSPNLPAYEHSAIIPLSIIASDENSGVLSIVKRLDGNVLNDDSIDTFYYRLGTYQLEIEATDRAGNSASASHEFTIIATIRSTLADINRMHTLGWADKMARNSLSALLNAAGKSGKIDPIIAKVFLKQLNAEYNKGNINQFAYNILKNDIEWLLRN